MARGKGKGNAGIVNNPVTGSGANDVLVGAAAMINGGDGDDHITGSDLIERINAGDGDDFIFGGGGDDTIFGNDGTDTAGYSGSLQDAVLTAGKGNSYTLTSADGGTDTLKHIEFIQFDDFTYEVGVNNGVFTRADSATTDEDTAITIDALANDFDFEGDSFSVTSFDAVSANGATVSLVNGEFVYDSSATESIQAMDDGDSMTDTFTYTVTDSAGNESTETVSVDVAGVSDSVIIDFDEGVNTVTYSDWYYKEGTYQEDGFTIDWHNYGYWYYGSNSAVPINDATGDGDNEFGYHDTNTGYYDYNYLSSTTLTKDDGGTFSLIDFDLETGADSASNYFSMYNGHTDATSGEWYYANAYIDDGYYYSTGGWYYDGYNENGYYSGFTNDEAEVASLFEDVASVELYASGWEYGGYYDRQGIQIDNIEIA
ncbi:MAG: Ig-like domain-containing protein [Paracoccaceae bacterium]|nr:Ig-like domain-containing protein [Paracoccaceae bacterium]